MIQENEQASAAWAIEGLSNEFVRKVHLRCAAGVRIFFTRDAISAVRFQ
jgi:hypothetical protein